MTADQTGRKPLTAALLMAAARPAPAARPELKEIFRHFAAAAEETLRGFTASPVRVESDGLGVGRSGPDLAEARRVPLVSPRGAITPLIAAERSLVMGLCEAAFGGSGSEPPDDGGDRPLSRIETRLRQALLDELAARLPEVMGRSLHAEFTAPGDDREPPPGAAEFDALTGRLLVHLLGYSGELRLILPEQAAGALLAAGEARAAPPSAGSLRGALMESSIILSARLPEELLPLAAVANLRVGQQLRLAATAATPLVIAAEGIDLHRARLASAGGRLAAEIIGA